MAEESFFQRVTRLFRSGPAIRRKIKGHDPNNYYDQNVIRANHGHYNGHAGYKRSGNPFSVMGDYGILDRLSKYSEFAEMEYTPEISTALDLYADETCSPDEQGKRFHVYSENPKIQKALEELFHEVVNVDFEARRDIRNLIKNGDFVRYVEVQPKVGVILTQPIPINEVSREEGFDPSDPTAVRFKLETYGGKYLENWQILHFRILSNDAHLPYGTSFLENVRRSWRQLCHASGTRVLTTTGYKNIEDVLVGDVVYTHLPEKKQTVKTTVEAVVDMGVQPLVLVETNHRTIKVTPNHGLLVRDKNGDFHYKKAEDLTESDALVLPAITSGKITETEDAETLKHLGYAIGYIDKQIPSWVYDLDLKGRKAFLQGLLSLGGYDDRKTICFEDKVLTQQTQELCWTIGIPVGKTITVRPERKGRKESYKLWLDLSKQTQEVVYENVLRVAKQEVGQTWDLQVKHEEHNFIANGVVTHNTMIEDAMLLYRMVRSPERRVFYIDISGIKPEDVANYMEAVQARIRSNTATNRTQGLTDLRYNPMSVDDDYFLPTRPNSGTKIETLAGGQHVSATEDVEYIRGKVIAGLKVPKAYLGFDEALSSKATLAQEDIRFSKTIQAIQEIYIAEFNKLAILHLFALGFQGEDLIDFELKLSNPSSVALQQKLAIISSRIDIAAKAWDLGKETGMVSIPWIQRNILNFRGEELNQIFEEAIEDQKRLAFLKFTLESKPKKNTEADANVDTFEQESAPAQLTGGTNQQQTPPAKTVSIAPDSDGLKRAFIGMDLAPIKAGQTPTQQKKNLKRSKQFSGQRATMNPGFAAMLDPKNKYNKDVYGQKQGSVLLENMEEQIRDSQKSGGAVIPEFLPASIQQTLRLFYESRMKEYEVEFEIEDIASEMKELLNG
jgi:hypothetical protein